MALPDSAEYWWPTEHREHKTKRVYPAHECTPRDVPDGTPYKWFCVICHKKINAGNWKKKHNF